MDANPGTTPGYVRQFLMLVNYYEQEPGVPAMICIIGAADLPEDKVQFAKKKSFIEKGAVRPVWSNDVVSATLAISGTFGPVSNPCTLGVMETTGPTSANTNFPTFTPVQEDFFL